MDNRKTIPFLLITFLTCFLALNGCACYQTHEEQNISSWAPGQIDKNYNDSQLYAICYESPPLPKEKVAILILDRDLTTYVVEGNSIKEDERKSKTTPCDPKTFVKSQRSPTSQPWQYKRIIELMPGQYCLRIRTVQPTDSVNLAQRQKPFKSLGFDLVNFVVRPGYIYWIDKKTERFYYLNEPYQASLLEVEQWIPEAGPFPENRYPRSFRKELLETVNKTRDQYIKMLPSVGQETL